MSQYDIKDMITEYLYLSSGDLFNPNLMDHYKVRGLLIDARTRIEELEQLEKFKKLVEFIANDYHELSHDKAQWQRDDWKKRCKKLIEEYYENTDSI